MHDSPATRPLKQLLGYGHELSDALHRYSHNATEDSSYLEGFAQWLSHCPHSEKICFLDVTIFREAARFDNALAILLATSDEHLHQYEKRLRQFTDDGYALAAHDSFLSGLRPKKGSGPIQMLVGELPDQKARDKIDSPDVRFAFTGVPPYEVKQSASKEYQTNRLRRIAEQWARWTQVYAEAAEAGELLSAQNQSLKHLLAIPVGSVGPTGSEDFEIAACVFLGLDCETTPCQVDECARYVLLQLIDNYSMPQSSRAAKKSGIGVGVESAVLAFGHQIKTLAAGITGHQKKWLFPCSTLKEFNDRNRPCELTPVPQLFDALGKTIAFWSLGHKPDSLGIPDEFLSNFLDVMQIACGFAESLHLASTYARVDMSNEDNLAELDAEYKVNLNASSLTAWKIDASAFASDDAAQCDDRQSVLPWHQLAGLIRFFAIAIEGAIEYAPSFAQPNVDFEIHCNAHRLCITSTNTCKPRSMRRGSDTRYAGMHGTDIRQFICHRYLESLQPLSDPIDEDTKYSVSLHIDKPQWLRLEGVHG
jgi:hypothetical protein